MIMVFLVMLLIHQRKGLSNIKNENAYRQGQGAFIRA